MQKSSKKTKNIESLCLLFCFLSFLASFEWSSSQFGLFNFFQIIFLKLTNTKIPENLETAKTILFDIRTPRILTASLCASALGVSGVISQGLFRNALASPSLIGSTSGALLGAVLCFYLGEAFSHSLSVSAFAIFGSLMSTTLLLSIYAKFETKNITKLLLIGLSFSTLSSALCSLIISLEDANPYKSAAIYRWLLGGFHSAEWSHFYLSVLPLCLGCFYAFTLTSKLDILSLGDDVALSLGVPIKNLKIMSLLTLSVLLGIVTSLAGPLPFVGLIVPHITRSLIGPSHKKLMTFTLFNSVSLVLLSDLFAKKILPHKELEIGIILSILGAPFFLYLIMRKGPYGN